MSKQALREEIWDDLDESGVARFPYPPHGRIPNFAGAEDAAARLEQLEVWQNAETIKANPDSPQLPVRRAALRQGKTIYMAVPRLAEEKPFLRLDPAEISDIQHATTIGGSAELGVQVGLEEMDRIDLIVAGSVAVTHDGARVGKGEGYSDLEFALLRAFDRVDNSTTTVTTLHERQVVEREVETADHDIPIDQICTTERHIRTDAGAGKPSSIDWDKLSDEKIAEIPVLQRLKPE